MLKISGLLAFVSCFIGFSAVSEAGLVAGNGGFNGPRANNVVKVKDIDKYWDDQNVSIVGYLQKSITHDEYEFRDETGTINVEIDWDVWRGVEATPKTKVQIFGEVEKSLIRKTKIDADSIMVVK